MSPPVSYCPPSKRFGFDNVKCYTKANAEKEIDELKAIKADIEARITLLSTVK
jgi:hypothetical protein